MMVKHDPSMWSEERLAGLEKRQLNALRENAAKAGIADLVERCDRELSRRAPLASRGGRAVTRSGGSGDFVAEYHFVCSKGRGVSDADGGRFWSGSWVVAAENVEQSMKFGALLALHERRSEPSYRQGEIVGWRRASRDMIDKDNLGIEFLVNPTTQALAWAGTASAEKGYLWAKASAHRPDPVEGTHR